jgi:signal transduction histidine kinase
MAFLLLDVVTVLIGQAYGLGNLGPEGLVPTIQMFLVPVAAAATMWGRTRTAVIVTAVVVVLAFVVGPTGEELWLELIVAVTVAIRATRVQLGLLVVCLVAYAVAYGFVIESRRAGWGWDAGLVTGAAAGIAFVVGLVARRLLRARDRRRSRIRQLEREQGQIRAVERARLADELQFLVTQGLARIEDDLDRATRGAADAVGLRHTLTRVDQHTRALLTELRTLLELLRREPATGSAGESSTGTPGARNWVDLLTARHVRLATTVVLGVLAVRVAAGQLSSPADALVPVLGLLACAVAVWRPTVAVAGATAALVVSLVLGSAGYWDALPVTLLCLMGALRFGLRRVWFLGTALAAYAGLLAVTDADVNRSHIVADCYAGFLGIAVGLAARYFLRARDDSLRQLVELTDDRDRMKTEERNAVARELHDVVAHSLSVIAMLVLATSLSNDRRLLSDTVDQVRRNIQATRQELSMLLHAMRGPDSDQQLPTPLVTPEASAQALARRLSDNGYHPVLSIDPAAAALDSTTQRTLTRIMLEGATNVLRYTPTGSTCHFTLAIGDCGVRLAISSPLAVDVRSSDLSLGWGLRGIRERVELTRGTFTAGPDRGRWLLEVTLPILTGTTISVPAASKSVA